MGLDMFVYVRNAAHGIEMPAIDFEGKGIIDEQIAYFRKHADLHGWMERLYREKGGNREFNLVNLRLTEDDLERLGKELDAMALPNTTGFFYGASTDEDFVATRTMIQAALVEIVAGNAVYYSSWW